jgi:hypothetical protein
VRSRRASGCQQPHQVEIEANELGALLIEVHRWRRVRRSQGE